MRKQMSMKRKAQNAKCKTFGNTCLAESGSARLVEDRGQQTKEKPPRRGGFSKSERTQRSLRLKLRLLAQEKSKMSLGLLLGPT